MGPSSDASSLSSSDTPSITPVQPAHIDLEKASTHHTQGSGAVKSERAQRIATAQDWTGPDDEGNPHNWKFSKKLYHLVMVALQAFTTYGPFRICRALGNTNILTVPLPPQ
jgi:hypothetical protein